MPKDRDIYIPTGFESQQRAAERKRKIAQAMLERGLSTSPNMQSWIQVLAQMGSAFAGKRLDKKADKMSDQVDADIRDAYSNAIAEFNAKAEGLDPTSPTYDRDLQALTAGAADNPWLEDAREPYEKAFADRLKERGQDITFGGQRRRAGGIKEGEFEPNKPTDMVLRAGPEGKDFVPNTSRITAALASQPNVTIANGVNSMRDPYNPSGSAAPEMPAQAAQPAVPAGDEASLVFSRLTPEEKDTVNRILQKYAGPGNTIVDMVPNNVPYGNPTNPAMPGGKQPDGVTTDGQPYWIINGIPYDNPEGR